MPQSDRKPNAADQFYYQSYDSYREHVARATRRRARALIYTLVVICCVLLLGLGWFAWSLSAARLERDSLLQDLAQERRARAQAELALADSQMRTATDALDTRVRSDIVDQRMVEQQNRAAQLDKEAEAVRLAKLAEANCITPRSVRTAAGL